MQRCFWCNNKNPKYIKYHDKEWGILNLDDKYLFEMLILESFQAGLSWECVLNKREHFREAYDNFDIDKIIKYDEKKQEELRSNEGIIRNRLKIKASIKNAQIFKKIQKEYGSFSNYLKTFTKDKITYEYDKTTNELSDNISKDLQKRGMTFVGSTIIYSYLQAIGVINSHEPGCFMYKEKRNIMLEEKNIEIEPLFEEYVDFDTFSKSDFRVVHIKECVAVPKSKKLLQFTLDDGTGTDRTILSGIHAFYEPDELIGKNVVAILNLPPRSMMGIDSCGMLLSAVHTESGEEKLHLMIVDDSIPAGAKLY